MAYVKDTFGVSARCYTGPGAIAAVSCIGLYHMVRTAVFMVLPLRIFPMGFLPWWVFPWHRVATSVSKFICELCIKNVVFSLLAQLL